METRITGGTAELARRIYWVGSIDWNGRETSGTFTGLPPQVGRPVTPALLSEKNYLIDTVKAPFAEEM